jgi:serine protease
MFFMKKSPVQLITPKTIRLLILTLTVLSLAIQSAFAQQDNYIIVYKSKLHKQNMLKIRTFTPFRDFNIIPAVAARLDVNQVEELSKNPNIAYIEPDYKIFALSEINEPLQPLSNIEPLASTQTIPYGINMVNAPLVWPSAKGAGARVAVLDTGISMYHPDRGNVVNSVSFATNQTGAIIPVEDLIGHGTHTSGTIAAADNDIGVIGVAPQADLLIAKVMDNTGSGQDSWLISGIDWAVSNNAKVISMSLGGYDYSQALDDACAAAFDAGTLLVAAAGNDNVSTPLYPAALPSVISVAAVDQSKNKASFSNYGPTIALAAPGVSVYSTIPVAVDSTVTANAIWSSTSHQANIITGTNLGTVSGQICNCGLATGTDPQDSCPDSVAGNIAHIRRGIITFAQKVAYAQSKGAIGVIISNNVSGNFNGTLNNGSPLIVVSISQADGNNLQALAQTGITGSASVNSNPYAYYSGTSMACPHVAGVAALIFAANPIDISPLEVRDILFNSAQDIGTPGRDDIYGYGLVDAYAALNLERMNLLAAFINYWLQPCLSPTWCDSFDSNHSGTVDFIDFSSLTQNW